VLVELKEAKKKLFCVFLCETTAKMEINSRFCEVSTYAASSSGYNSSTASSSLNFIDNISAIDNCTQIETIDCDKSSNNSSKQLAAAETVPTKLIITITLLKTEKV
jgi:hypothetical protein